ncbi:TPA: hypothetical protein ACOW2D_001279 [Enterococcus faecalis]
MRTQYPVFKVPINHPAILDGLGDMSAYTRDSLLFDLKRDPLQMTPLQEREKEAEMIDQLIRVMTEMDAPQEQYQRLALI